MENNQVLGFPTFCGHLVKCVTPPSEKQRAELAAAGAPKE
jgi:hypothetical protein